MTGQVSQVIGTGKLVSFAEWVLWRLEIKTMNWLDDWTSTKDLDLRRQVERHCKCVFVSGPENLYEQLRLRIKTAWDTTDCLVHGRTPNR